MEHKYCNEMYERPYLKLIVIFIMLVLSGCSGNSEISPTQAASVTSSVITSVNTSIPLPTETSTTLPEPTSTPDPVLTASESISVFKPYDDFSGPFNRQKWNITEPDEDNPFSYEMKDGLLLVHMNGDQFGPDRFAHLDVDTNLINENTNGVSVVLPPNDHLDASSPYGLRVNFTDQKSHWTYQCYKLTQAVRFYCGLEDAISGAELYNMQEIQISRYTEIKLQIEWIRESGLILTFLNNQLIDSYTIKAGNPLEVEKIGMFVHRADSYADGDLVFSNFRIGTYQGTNLVLPDALQSTVEKTYQFSNHGIDYYLYDDFNHPLYENYIDLNRWYIGIDQDGRELIGQNTFFGQRDGRLDIQGTFLINAIARDWNPSVRGLQVDVISGDESLPGSGAYLFLTGRIPNANSQFGDYVFSNECKVEFTEKFRGRVWCHYLEGYSQTEIEGFGDSPLYRSDTNTVDISYNDTLGTFELRVNGNLAGQSYVKENHKAIIEKYGLTAEIYLANEENNRIVLDNYLIGTKSDTSSEPSEPVFSKVDAVLPHSDLYLYDDFEDAQFDGAWDVGKWLGNYDINDDVGMHQENGTLVHGKLPGKNQTNAWNLRFRQFSDIPDLDINAMQIEIAPYHPQPDSLITINIFAAQLDENSGMPGMKNRQSMNGNPVQFNCGVTFMDYQEALVCRSQTRQNGSQLFDSIEIPGSSIDLNPEYSHMIAVELDRESRVYSVYLDSTLLVTYEVPPEYPLGVQDFYIQSGGNLDNQNTVAQIENIWIGTTATHPELLMKNYVDGVKSDNDTATENPEMPNVNNVELIGLDGGTIENKNILVLPEGATDHHVIRTNMQNGFKLSDINSASITYQPMDISLSGWTTIMAFYSSDNSYQINCNIQYDGNNAAFYCKEQNDGNSPEAYSTEEIQIDPELPHQVSMVVDPETNLLHVLLDQKNMFDIDTQRPPTFFKENTFNYLFLVYNHDASGREFRMKVSDIQIGVPVGK